MSNKKKQFRIDNSPNQISNKNYASFKKQLNHQSMKNLESTNQSIIQNLFLFNNDLNIQPKSKQNLKQAQNVYYPNIQRQLNRVNSNNKLTSNFIIKNKSGSLDSKQQQLNNISNYRNMNDGSNVIQEVNHCENTRNQSKNANQLNTSNQMFHKKLSEKHKGQIQNQSLKQQLQNQVLNQQQSSRIPQEMYQSQNIDNIINRQLLNEKIKINPINVRNSMNNQKQMMQYLNQNDKQKLQYQIQIGAKQLKPFNQQQQTSEKNRYKDLHLKNLSNKYQQNPMKHQENGQNINLSQLINQIKNSEYENKPTQNSRNPSNPKLKDFQDHKMTQSSQQSNLNQTSKKDFELQHVVGKGGFGKVWKVVCKKTKKVYAMKDMMKSKIIVKKSVHSVMNERHLLTTINNEFIVNMQCAFQDKENLYLVMDYLPGGDLRYHIGRTRRFNELQTKFFSACLLVALQDLHKNNIIHRDIKPENLVLDRRGYMRVTDLGIARIKRDENYQDTSGTPGYMAPEVMCRQNHSFEVDYFALGVIIYEFMLGRRPYYGRNRKEIRDQMIAKQVQVSYQEKPDGWSNDAVDICNVLLQRKPQDRLGYEGIQEIISHPWYSNLNWNKLKRKELPSPYLPTSKENNYDPRQLQSSETDEEVEEQNYILLRKPQMQNMFNGYYYEMKEEQQKQQQPQKKNGSLISTNITNNQTTSNPSNS